MNQKLEEYKTAIRKKVIELARRINLDANSIKDDEIIPETGYLDSTSIIELIVWYENHFGLEIADDEITLDSFGSIRLMATYALSKLNSRE